MTKSCGTVLVVDDDRQIRETLAFVLQDEGYRVIQAKDGQDAMVQLRAETETPCVILLDLMMPVMDGFQFRAEQLGDANLADIPVVVLSADTNLPVAARNLRIERALKKPVHLDDVLEILEEYC